MHTFRPYLCAPFSPAIYICVLPDAAFSFALLIDFPEGLSHWNYPPKLLRLLYIPRSIRARKNFREQRRDFHCYRDGLCKEKSAHDARKMTGAPQQPPSCTPIYPLLLALRVIYIYNVDILTCWSCGRGSFPWMFRWTSSSTAREIWDASRCLCV